MTRDEFWALIEKHISAHDDLEDQADGAGRLTDELAKRNEQDCIAFDQHCHELSMASYTRELWGAAYLINGGCSDDGFDDFRGWLIGRGRVVYEQAVKDPDSLAALLSKDTEELELEELLTVGMSAWRDITDKDYADMPQKTIRYPELGADWDFDDQAEMRRRYPKLAALFAD